MRMTGLHELWERHGVEEAVLVRRALERADWNQREASRILGCAVTTLVRVLERHPEVDCERRRRLRAA